MEKAFEIRAYGTGELARMYFPEDESEFCTRNSWRKVSRWIEKNSKLKQALTKLGFTPGIRTLSPKMVEEIISYLGTP